MQIVDHDRSRAEKTSPVGCLIGRDAILFRVQIFPPSEICLRLRSTSSPLATGEIHPENSRPSRTHRPSSTRRHGSATHVDDGGNGSGKPTAAPFETSVFSLLVRCLHSQSLAVTFTHDGHRFRRRQASKQTLTRRSEERSRRLSIQ